MISGMVILRFSKVFFAFLLFPYLSFSSYSKHETLPYAKYFYSPLEFYNPNLTSYLNELSANNFRVTKIPKAPRLSHIPSVDCVSVVSVSTFEDIVCDHLPDSCGNIQRHVVLHKGIPFIRQEIVLCIALTMSTTFDTTLFNASFGDFPSATGVQLPVPIENFLKFPGKPVSNAGLIFVHSLDATNVFSHILLRPHPSIVGGYLIVPKLCYEYHPTISEFKRSLHFNSTHFCYSTPNYNTSRLCSVKSLEMLFGVVSLTQLTRFVMDNAVIFTQDDVGLIPMDGYSFSSSYKFVKKQKPQFALSIDAMLSQDDLPILKYYTLYKTESGYYLYFVTDKPYGLFGNVNVTCHSITRVHTTYSVVLLRKAGKELEKVLKAVLTYVFDFVFSVMKVLLKRALEVLMYIIQEFTDILRVIIETLNLSNFSMAVLVILVTARQRLRDWFQVLLIVVIVLTFWVGFSKIT